MWQKIELVADENTEVINGGVDSGEAGKRLAELGGILAQVNQMPDAPKKEKAKKVKSTIISSDPVNHPEHYTAGGIETIDFIKAKLTPEEFQGYLKGNIIKYTSRAGKKSEMVQDFEKGQWYMNRLVGTLKGNV